MYFLADALQHPWFRGKGEGGDHTTEVGGEGERAVETIPVLLPGELANGTQELLPEQVAKNAVFEWHAHDLGHWLDVAFKRR